MNEWVWSYGGMILTTENWSIGTGTLYSVCGRWMNEYGVFVDWYWQKTEVLGEEHCTACVVDKRVWSIDRMIMKGETQCSLRETWPSATFSAQIPHWLGRDRFRASKAIAMQLSTQTIVPPCVSDHRNITAECQNSLLQDTQIFMREFHAFGHFFFSLPCVMS
jgi:hypothetical protein